MGRKILFITTDQQRYDALGCNGGTIARTPVVDRLAATGINYRRAHNQNVVCMPARSTMLTGQYVRTHGVFANGVPLPPDAPSVAARLHEHAATAPRCSARRTSSRPSTRSGRWFENRMAREGSTGPYRGFEHLELAMHVPLGGWHYSLLAAARASRGELSGFAPLLSRAGRRRHRRARGGLQPDPARAVPHRLGRRPHDRVARLAARRRRLVLLDELPRPAPSVGPARVGGAARAAGATSTCRPAIPGSREKIVEILAQKPRHWLDVVRGPLPQLRGRPDDASCPQDLTHDQIREVNALVHVENELIDEACGRVLRRIAERGWDADTDVFFTTDHGELQGDFGLLYKGPYHIDALMRIPLIWRPAPSARRRARRRSRSPSASSTWRRRSAGSPACRCPSGCRARRSRRRRAPGASACITEWDSQFAAGRHAPAHDLPRRLHLHRLRADARATSGWDLGAHDRRAATSRCPTSRYDGTEGELYDVRDDPHQWRNLWNDPGRAEAPRRISSPTSTTTCRRRARPRCAVEAPA